MNEFFFQQKINFFILSTLKSIPIVNLHIDISKVITIYPCHITCINIYERVKREKFFFLNVYDRSFWKFVRFLWALYLSNYASWVIVLKQKPKDVQVLNWNFSNFWSNRRNLANVKFIHFCKPHISKTRNLKQRWKVLYIRRAYCNRF